MTDYEAMRIDQDRDPIVTDQVMRRLLATGEIRQTRDAPPAGGLRGATSQTWRSHDAGPGGAGLRAHRGPDEQTLGIVERSLDALGAARGRKSLVLVSSGLVAGLAPAGLPPRRHRVAGAPTRPSTSSTRAACVRPRTPGSTLRSRARRHHRPQHRASASARRAERERGQRRARQGQRRLRDREPQRPRRRPRPHRPRGAQLLPARLRACQARCGRPLPRDRGEARPAGSHGARAARVLRAGQGRRAAGRGPRRGLPARARRAIRPLRAAAARDRTGRSATPGGQDDGAAHGRGRHPLARVRREGRGARDTLETLLVVADRGRLDYTRFDQQFEMALQSETRARYERDGFPITRELALEPGAYQAKLVARDRNGGRLGSVTHEFVVPQSSGLRISSLVLGDRLREAEAPQARTLSPPPAGPSRPAAFSTVASRSTVRIATVERRAERHRRLRDAPQRRQGRRGRRRDAAAARSRRRPRAEPRRAARRRPAGRYEVIVVVTDLVAGRSAEAREAVRIEAPAPN